VRTGPTIAGGVAIL